MKVNDKYIGSTYAYMFITNRPLKSYNIAYNKRANPTVSLIYMR